MSPVIGQGHAAQPPISAAEFAELAASVTRLEADLGAYRSNIVALATAILELRIRASTCVTMQDVRVAEIAELERFVAEATGRLPR